MRHNVLQTTVTRLLMKAALMFLLAGLWAVPAQGQVNFQGNQNDGFGGVVGQSDMEWSDDGETITVHFNVGSGDFNDAMVIYVFTGAEGRNVIDGDVDDEGDDLRRAISSAGENASDITFPEGFEASHAIAINTGFGGLWEIPADGVVEENELPFVDDVSSTLSDNDDEFIFSFDWEDIGLEEPGGIGFVATYLNGDNGFTSNEGYGAGLPGENPGGDDFSFTSYFEYPSGNEITPGQVTTAQAGNWNDEDTWVGNIPQQGDVVTIAHNVTLDVDAEIAGLTVEDGNTLTSQDEEGRELTLENLANFTIEGTFEANDGKVIFTGDNDVSGEITFNNADLFGGANFGDA